MGQRLWKMNDIILNILILCCLGCGQKVSFWTSQYHTRFRQTFSETSIVILCFNFNFLGWFRRSQFLQPTRNYRELVSEFFSIGQCNWQQSSKKKKKPWQEWAWSWQIICYLAFHRIIGENEKEKKKEKREVLSSFQPFEFEMTVYGPKWELLLLFLFFKRIFLLFFFLQGLLFLLIVRN